MKYSHFIQRFFAIILIAFSLILGIFLYGCNGTQAAQEQPQAPSVEVITLNPGSATTYKDYSATLEGRTNVEIRPQVEGTLEEVFVDEGAYVKAGQSLFRINDRPFREQLNSAIASMHAAEAAMINAQLEVDKLTPLVQNKVVSEIQLKTAKAAYQVAKANAEQAKALAASAQINLDYTLIKAPVNGYVSRLPKKIGSLVGRADMQALTTISDVERIHAYFSLSETDFMLFKEQYAGSSLQEKIKNIPPVVLTLADGSIYPQKGKIDLVDGQFDRNTGAIMLRASFPNEQGLLRSGNTGKVRLSQELNTTLLVPQVATVELQEKVFVFAVNDSNKVSKQMITIIGRSGNDYLVKDGVSAGSRIVYSGMDHVQEGGLIMPRAISLDSLKN